jgi:hypothetical protein
MSQVPMRVERPMKVTFTCDNHVVLDIPLSSVVLRVLRELPDCNISNVLSEDVLPQVESVLCEGVKEMVSQVLNKD